MAKKLYLVDERTFKNLKTPWQNAIVDKFQEAAWSKPPEKRSKTEMYKDMHNLLDDDDMNDDEKAKLYNQQYIRYQNTNKGTEMQPIKQEEEQVVAVKHTKRKRKSKQASLAAWEDLPTRAPSPIVETGSWQKVVNKKKKKVISTPVRRSSRPRKSITWDALYDV